MKGEYETIKICTIRRPAYPDRLEVSTASLLELMASIDAIGLLHPISVKPLDNGFELISGDRRLAAAIGLHWTEIPCKVHEDISAIDVCIVRAQENLHRHNLSPIEEAYSVQRVHSDHQLSLMDIAQRFGRSHNWVVSRLSLCDMSESLRTSVHNGSLKIGHALALAGVDDDATRESMHDLCRSEGATLSVLLSWISEYKSEVVGIHEHFIPESESINPVPATPATAACTICGELEALPELVWKPICGTCMRAAS